MRAGAGLSIRRPDWSAPVTAGFTTRHGGVSRPPWDSLNLATHVGDDPQVVAENRRRLVERAGLPEEPRWLRQIHGNRVVHARDVERDVTEADAVWTDQPGQVCAVLVADCVPILLAAADGSCVAAVHAGWRGLAAGVIPAAIAALPVEPDRLCASVGPCIGEDAYEVGGEVIEQLRAGGVVPEYRAAVEASSAEASGADAGEALGSKPDRYHLDLTATTLAILKDCGVGAATATGLCTYADTENSYSYRRDGATGRLAGFVVKNG
ncbi:peptidoglycan editing factor PgeF [Spiribacter vilamensis]|uniref:peptidoglycan editing factor PgeF n=1 Tax=Spiribacter vilamensis TaxID=531306 RepID=UPI00102C53F4|nr:peptidoglycan editing factor PgeF [Spiribacter vilamensis]TVO62411.1 peptidoglycan editing factor PgeF [Spiribacter vilamensis]